jgi:hypothetical protein
LDTEFTKLEFLNALHNICMQTFKTKTIQGAFRKCGLVPFNLKLVLNALPNDEPQPPTSLALALAIPATAEASTQTPVTVLE